MQLLDSAPRLGTQSLGTQISPRYSVLASLLVLSLVGSPTVSADDSKSAASERDFASIFDGESLAGWSGKPEFWSVEGGAITGRTTKDKPTSGNTFLIWEDGKPKDFELRLQFRIVGGNSGIQYRSKHVGNHVVAGYQADFEAGDRYIGILYEEKGRGILALRGQKVVIQADGTKEVVGKTSSDEEVLGSIKKEDWNEYTIIAKGNHLVQKLNGHVTVDVTDKQKDKAAESGILALQLHAGPPMLVQFKDIRLKELK